MKMNITTAFRLLETRRQNRLNASKKFVVKSVNKDGSISRMRPDVRTDGFEDAERAEARRDYLEKLNPGRRFVVVPL